MAAQAIGVRHCAYTLTCGAHFMTYRRHTARSFRITAKDGLDTPTHIIYGI